SYRGQASGATSSSGFTSGPACAGRSYASACEHCTRCSASSSASQRDGCSYGCDRPASMYSC
ncbi:hypothetical protein, partial [Acidovorax temperans]|uniref:hypothetical protein n=1 Tax=Acidovorax temperans TaxID=80878 RepID=UPI00196A1811